MSALAAAASGRAGTARGEVLVHVVQGDFHVTGDPAVVLTTILGSCVAACVRDPLAGIGGMNHFLLPSGEADDRLGSLRFGVHAMELLINEVLRGGGRRDRLEAKLFGGGRMMQGLHDVGATNVAFAEAFLRSEGIRFAGGSLRGEGARRIQYWPVSGRARQSALGSHGMRVFAREKRVEAVPVEAGHVDLF